MTRLILFSGTTMAKALQAGERWITVHPNGPDAKGTPILIQEQKDGSAKVVGGAGGKLNHLRLTGVKAKGEYADTLKKRADARKEAAKQQRTRDKALGLQESKAKAKIKVDADQRAAQREFVKGVAEAMGWTPEETTFNEEAAASLDERVANKARLAHHVEVLKRAKEAVALNRERILIDHGARVEGELGEVPLDSVDPDKLSVQDLDPVSLATSGLGFKTDYKSRAEANGADVEAEAREAAPAKTDAQQRAAGEAKGLRAKLKEGIELLRDADDVQKLAPKLVEAKKAVELLKMDKKLRLAEQQAKKARQEINAAVEEPKAYVIEVSDADVDAKVADEVANDLRTISTRAFLAEVAKRTDNPASELQRHVGAGAYNSVNALALAAGGAALVDRSVVDVLGVGGAAAVLARRLNKDLAPDEYQNVADAMGEFHLHHYMEASDEAIARAGELADQAAEIQLGEAENGGDLAVMQELNKRRADALNEANKVLGTALGEMEANAALVYALGRGADNKPFEVSLGNVSMEGAVAQVRAIGLQRGDYVIESVSGNRVLKVQPQGLDRLAAPVNRADLEQTRRNLEIMSGVEDQDGWMPAGIVDRADLDSNPKPGAAPTLAQPFRPEPGDDLETAVSDYIGGRAADGDRAADIVADLQSSTFLDRVCDRRADYMAALDKLAPAYGEDGKALPADTHAGSFDQLADQFVEKHYGQARTALHSQTFDAESVGVEALHRALAAAPTGVAAYKPVGELTPQDQGALREAFAKKVARETPQATATRRELEQLETTEPEKHVEDMFGDQTVNGEWIDWKSRRDQLRATVAAGSTTWPKYVEAMRSPERAYAAMQDLVRSDVNKHFADAYNTLNPGKPLKVGRSAIRDHINHLDAVDPAAREARQAKERVLTDSLRERAGGRYAKGAVADKLDAAREDQAGLEAAQMGLFGGEDMPDRDADPLGADERHYLGHAAERQIAAMMPKVGANFRPGQPVKLFRPTMSGGKNWARQRLIKMAVANKRVIASFGTGSGKTLIGLGAFTELHDKGQAKRGLFLVPSISQGGFHAEALRFLKPGTYSWHAKPGAGRDERLAAYKDPKHHFAVMTHQSFRDDMLHLGATHAGLDEAAMSAKVADMGRDERRDWIKGVMSREGINFDYLNVDEGHNLLDREGKETSAMAAVIDALGDHVPNYINASADPVKNDVSEAFSLLQKMDPARYTDRAAFMRKYGVDTLSAKDGLKRELARFQYPSKIDPDVTANRIEHKVGVAGGQKAAIDAVGSNVAAARLARIQGKVDVAAIKALAPDRFEGVPDDQHEALARALTKNLGLIKASAMRKALEAHKDGADLDAVVQLAKERKGKQGIVFAHSLASVEAIKQRLTTEGLRVGVITGKDSAKEKAKRIDEYRPPDGSQSNVDVMVASDAGATGANLQSGRYLINFDTPDTAMTHAQRNGRINRTGQEHDVDLIDLVRDHPDEEKRRSRLKRKYGLRDMMTSPMDGLDDTGVGGFLARRRVAAQNGGLL